jgi:hypothetical protein
MKLCIVFVLISVPMFICSCKNGYFGKSVVRKSQYLAPAPFELAKKYIPPTILAQALNLDVRANALSDFYDLSVLNDFTRNQICAANAVAAHINRRVRYNSSSAESVLFAAKSFEFVQGDNFLAAINEDGSYVYGFAADTDYNKLADLANALVSIRDTALILDTIVGSILGDLALADKVSIDIGNDPTVFNGQPTSLTFNENVDLAIARAFAADPSLATNSVECTDFTSTCDLIICACTFAKHASSYLNIINADIEIVNAYIQLAYDLENLSSKLSVL